MAKRVPKRNIILACEELNYTWSEEQLREVKDLWKEGVSIKQIADHVKRHRKEIVIALIDKMPEPDLARMFGERWGTSLHLKPKDVEGID